MAWGPDVVRILAVDVSLRRSGFALLEDEQVIGVWACPIANAHDRPLELHGLWAFSAAIIGALPLPDFVAIETSAQWQREGHDRTATIVALSEARVAVICAAFHVGISPSKLRQMDAHEVRYLIAGNRFASKEQLQRCLQLRGYTLPEREQRMKSGGHYVTLAAVDSDKCDAVALALACLAKERLLAMAERRER